MLCLSDFPTYITRYYNQSGGGVHISALEQGVYISARNMKLENIAVFENISNKFDIGHCQTKVKVTARLRNFSLFTTKQTVRSDDSTYIKHVCLFDTNIQNL